MGRTLTTGFIPGKVINGIPVKASIPSNTSNYNVKKSRLVNYIIVHYTGNAKKDSAFSNAKYFNSGYRAASAHFFVDDNDIYQSVALCNVAWHCGGVKYYHASARNTNSIGIEMCCTGGAYTVSEDTISNTAYLVAYICELIGITADDVDTYVLRHYDITHKNCPAQMVKSEQAWKDFKMQVKYILRYVNHVGSYTSGGIDYKWVFDPKYYANKYQDLKNAGITTESALFMHFLKFGMNERRQAHPDFNVNIYSDRYEDLQKAFASDWPKYYQHYCKFGVNEGRSAK